MTDDELLALANGKKPSLSDDDLLAIANKPKQEDVDQRLLDVANGKAEPSPAVAPQPERPGIGLENFMDVVPGVSAVRKELLAPIAEPIERVANKMATPLIESPSVAKNIASGLPGTILSVPMQFVSDTVKQLPEQVALMGAGKVAKTTEIFPKIADYVSAKFPFLVHRGSMTEAGRKAFGAFDTANIKGKQTAEEIASMMVRGSGGIKYSKGEQGLIAQLVEQKGQRDALLAVEGRSVPANWAALAEDVPGVKGAKEAAGFFPRTELPSSEYAKTADVVSTKLSELRKAIVESGAKEDEVFQRFHENYLPRVPAGNTIKTYVRNLIPSRIREKSKFLTGRSDMTDKAREALGFQKPAVAVGVRIAQEDSLVNTHKLFGELSQVPEIAPKYLDGQIGRTGDIKKFVTPDGKGLADYVKLAADKEYGVLAGKWVRKGEADEINYMRRQTSEMGNIARQWWSAWKFGKTIMSPKTHLRNFTSNAGLAHIDGELPPWRMDIYNKAHSDMKAGAGAWTEAKGGGASWTSRTGSQLDDVISPDALSGKKGSNVVTAFLSDLPRWAMNNKASKFLANGYQDSEAFFKQAVYTYRRSIGEDVPTAIARAERAIINYDKMPIWVKKLRSAPGAIPFVSFTYGVTPIMARAAIEKPHILNSYNILYKSWNKLTAENIKLTPEEKREIEINFPGTVPLVMPWRDEDGSAMVFDVARWTPGSDMLPGRVEVPGMSAVPQIAQNIVGKSPLVQEAVAQGSGRDPFSRRDFITPTPPGANEGLTSGGATPQERGEILDTLGSEEARARWRHLAGSVLPPVAPGGKDFMNVLDAFRGKTDFTGRVSPISEAVIGSVVGLPRNLDMQRAMNAGAAESAVTNFGKVKERQAIRDEAMQGQTPYRKTVNAIKNALASPQ